MPTPFQSNSNHRATFYTTGQKKPGIIERIAVIGSATAIALFVVIDIVRADAPDAPPATPTFRSAAVSGGAIRPAAAPDEQWAADDSAKGTRPDASH